jgi:hypothetical protein
MTIWSFEKGTYDRVHLNAFDMAWIRSSGSKRREKKKPTRKLCRFHNTHSAEQRQLMFGIFAKGKSAICKKHFWECPFQNSSRGSNIYPFATWHVHGVFILHSTTSLNYRFDLIDLKERIIHYLTIIWKCFVQMSEKNKHSSNMLLFSYCKLYSAHYCRFHHVLSNCQFVYVMLWHGCTVIPH